MKKLLSVVFAAVVVVVSGCASVQVTELADLSGMKLTQAEEPVAHINAQNWGFYFLSVPLITGSAENPGKIAFFSEAFQIRNDVVVFRDADYSFVDDRGEKSSYEFHGFGSDW